MQILDFKWTCTLKNCALKTQGNFFQLKTTTCINMGEINLVTNF